MKRYTIVLFVLPLLCGSCLAGCTVHGARHIEGDVFGFHYSFTDRAERNTEGVDTYAADMTPAWLQWLFSPKTPKAVAVEVIESKPLTPPVP